MASAGPIAALQKWMTNRLDDSAAGDKSIAGVIGDAPSQYSKSPALWNAAFRTAAINAIYFAFDVADAHVGDLLRALKQCDRAIGANVTVPHKVRVLDYLDEIDAGAAQIQAVNTIVRERSGRLIGYNTDGQGFVESILAPQPGQKESFVRSLAGADVLLLGAGGSARAVAVHVSRLLSGGRLVICNRTVQHALALAGELERSGGRALGIAEDQLATWAKRAALIINCTTKGQGGIRSLPDGRCFTMEPYSALAPAQPPALADGADRPEWLERWRVAASRDVEDNNRASLALAQAIPAEARFYDLIYHPEETVFLRHGRMTGHLAMSGKALIINQAALAFCNHICREELRARGINNGDTYRRVLEAMYRAW